MLVLNFMLSLMTSFKTIFSLGDNDMVVDAICSQLFESNWDVYAEDELSVDWELIYSPPPLDKVWLSESECQDGRNRFKPSITGMKNVNVFRCTILQYLLCLLILL